MNDNFIDQYWGLVGLGVLWEVCWKGVALWKAAKQSDKAWFVVLLFINTLGLLPMAYIFIFSKRVNDTHSTEPES